MKIDLNPNKVKIRAPKTECEWKRYYQIRYEVLRQPWNQPVGSEKTENEADCIHFALFIDGEMKGVLRMDELNAKTVQLRFMAILNKNKGQGLGKKLMCAAEEKAKKLSKSTIVLQARENAVLFYERIGFSIVKKSHLLYNTIQHYEMIKVI